MGRSRLSVWELDGLERDGVVGRACLEGFGSVFRSHTQ